MKEQFARNRDIKRWRDAGLSWRKVSQRAGVEEGRAREIYQKQARKDRNAEFRTQSHAAIFAYYLKIKWPAENAKLRRKRRHANNLPERHM